MRRSVVLLTIFFITTGSWANAQIAQETEVEEALIEVVEELNEQELAVQQEETTRDFIPVTLTPATIAEYQTQAANRYQSLYPTQWEPASEDVKSYQSESIGGQSTRPNTYSHPTYPEDMDYFGHINKAIFAKNPELKKNYDRLITTNACPGCVLRGLQFKGRWFYKRDQHGVNHPADLRCADLTDCNFDSARLGGADLRGAVCNNTTFNYTALIGANCMDADFSRPEAAKMPQAVNYSYTHEDRKLRSQFSYTNAIRTIFDNCNFTNVDFSAAFLMGSSFINANFTNAGFLQNTDLTNATFAGARNFILEWWRDPEHKIGSNSHVEQRVYPGTQRFVCDTYVKFTNTVLPNGRVYTGTYGSSDVFRIQAPTVQTGTKPRYIQ